MSLSIRYAGLEDAVLIADISHQTFYDTFAAANTRENMDKFLNEQFTKGKLMMEVGLVSKFEASPSLARLTSVDKLSLRIIPLKLTGETQ